MNAPIRGDFWDVVHPRLYFQSVILLA